MRIGILGSGFMGRTHARCYANIPGVQIVAVSSRHLDKAEKLAADTGARATTDDRSIIEDPSIDAISNTLPTHLHGPSTIAALEAGKHVLLEKPFALTAPDCDGMIAAQKRTGRTLMIAHVLRFWGDYVSLVEFVHSGKIGKPMSAIATRLSQMPAWADWFLNPAWSGGAVLDLSVHDFDVLNWVLGTPKSVYGRGHELKPGLWNDIHASLDYGGANGFVEGSEFMPAGLPVHRGVESPLRGRGGRIHVPRRRGQRRDGRRQLAPRPRSRQGLSACSRSRATPTRTRPSISSSCLREGRPVEQGTPEQARLAVQTADAARRSFETGAVVPL